LGIIVLCGALANHLDPGPLVAGMRAYLRAVPFFFVPVVYAFSEAQIRTQFKLLIGVCLLQGPVALAQRYATLARDNSTGDTTVGTLGLSSFLTIFLVCAACVLTAAFLKKRISFK